MKKVILICDRCGKQYNKWVDIKRPTYAVAEVVYDDYEPQLDAPNDLCEDCYLSLEKWFNYKLMDKSLNYADMATMKSAT